MTAVSHRSPVLAIWTVSARNTGLIDKKVWLHHTSSKQLMMCTGTVYVQLMVF